MIPLFALLLIQPASLLFAPQLLPASTAINPMTLTRSRSALWLEPFADVRAATGQCGLGEGEGHVSGELGKGWGGMSAESWGRRGGMSVESRGRGGDMSVENWGRGGHVRGELGKEGGYVSGELGKGERHASGE